MSQSPDHTPAAAGDLNINDADELFALLQSAVDGDGEGDEYRIISEHYDDDDDDDEDDDDDYEDAAEYEVEIEEEEEIEDDEEGAQEGEEEDDDDEDEDDEDTFPDEGTPIPYLTRRQLNLLLQGETLHNVLLSVTDWGRAEARFGARARRQNKRDPNRFPKVPSTDGRELMDSGVFGASELPERVNPTILEMAQDERVGNPENMARLKSSARVEARRRSLPMRLLDREMGRDGTYGGRAFEKKIMAQSMVPGTKADMVLRYDAAVYLGQFSDDGNFFYNATKDFHVRMYDTSNVNEWRHYKTVEHPMGRWTMTDASLSPDNRWLAFTSMMPQVCLAPTDPNDEGEPYLLNLSAASRDHEDTYFSPFAIFSVRFSGDGREIVAGTNDNTIVVYDIESRQILHRLQGHDSDVNAVCFGDKASPHILYSGSDDATIKVWDRRSLQDNRPTGAFVGHCEGITYIDSKGDGRYILSNGKDQTTRLWDLRKAMSYSDFEAKDPAQYTRYSMYDYRYQTYGDDDFFKHKYDNSVVTFRGHRIERTLLRCHFSPAGSSDGRYVYSASHTGEVFIWNMDATLAGVIDVQQATDDAVLSALNYEEREAEVGGHNTTASADRPRLRQHRANSSQLCVRDASWHPTEPILAASSFDSDTMESGLCTVHSCDLINDGDLTESSPRLYDEKMRPMRPSDVTVRSNRRRW